jgi:ribosomal-protein-alanine N-acetyltransferase
VLEVRASNARAVRLYRSLGFVATRRLASYYPDGEDALSMIRPT